MLATRRAQDTLRPVTALDCGIPLDSQYFDDARVLPVPVVGATQTVARFELPAQYCGVLEYFAQFTDLFGRDPSAVETPGLRWQILANRQPLYPYHQLELIVNPWGNGSFQFSVRLPEGAVVEMVVRRIAEPVLAPANQIARVGGRLMGRFWYNSAYGNATAAR
jgi:hypothetical protein